MNIKTRYKRERFSVSKDEGKIVFLCVPDTMKSEHHHFEISKKQTWALMAELCRLLGEDCKKL